MIFSIEYSNKYKQMIPNLLYTISQLGWVLKDKNTSSDYLVSTGIQGLALWLYILWTVSVM